MPAAGRSAGGGKKYDLPASAPQHRVNIQYVQYLQGPKAVNLSIYCQYLQRKAVNIQHQHLLRNRQLIQGWLALAMHKHVDVGRHAKVVDATTSQDGEPTGPTIAPASAIAAAPTVPPGETFWNVPSTRRSPVARIRSMHTLSSTATVSESDYYARLAPLRALFSNCCTLFSNWSSRLHLAQYE